VAGNTARVQGELKERPGPGPKPSFRLETPVRSAPSAAPSLGPQPTLAPPRPIAVAVMAFTLSVLLALTVPSAAHAQNQENWLEVELATVGVDLATGAPLALVHEGWDEVLPIWIGTVEAEAIMRVLQGQAPPRPMTHDLMASMLRSLAVELEEVRIHDLRDGTYIGSLHLREEGRDGLREVDTRPSDGLALAVRTGARIRVARHLLGGVPDVDFVSTERNRTIARIRGVTVAEPGEEDRSDWTVPADEGGVVVLNLGVGMATRGLEPGDLIVEADGTPVESVLTFLNAVHGTPDETPIPVTVLRDGQEVEVEIPTRRTPGRIGP